MVVEVTLDGSRGAAEEFDAVTADEFARLALQAGLAAGFHRNSIVDAFGELARGEGDAPTCNRE